VNAGGKIAEILDLLLYGFKAAADFPAFIVPAGLGQSTHLLAQGQYPTKILDHRLVIPEYDQAPLLPGELVAPGLEGCNVETVFGGGVNGSAGPPEILFLAKCLVDFRRDRRFTTSQQNGQSRQEKARFQMS
jgi:hypothetical protein